MEVDHEKGQVLRSEEPTIGADNGISKVGLTSS